jgi:hypothetical protein
VFPVIVHNQCLDFELVSPEYLGYDVIWHILPDQKVNANTMTSAAFKRDISKLGFTTALLYKLCRRSHNSDDQSNADNTKDTSTNIQLLVIWRSVNRYEFRVNAILIKHESTITWDKEKLMKLCSMYRTLNKYDRIIEDTWLLDDEAVLMTILKWGAEKHTIEITISEATKKDDSIEPLWVPSNM